MYRDHRAKDKVKDKAEAPALIGILSDDRIPVSLFGGSQLKAGEDYLFPCHVKTQVFVSQSGYDHTPCIGFELFVEHGELHGPCSTATHFDADFEIKATNSYKLSFVVPVKASKVMFFKLDPVADEEDLDTLPSVFLPHSIIDANKKGMLSFRTSSLTSVNANTSKL